jgi:hypothetical protein
MIRHAFVSAFVFLALTISANAQEKLDEQQFFPSAFVWQAPEDYLQMDIDRQQQEPGFNIDDARDFDFTLPEDFRLTTQTNMTPNINSTSLASYGSSILFLQQGASEAALSAEAQQALIAQALANPLSYLWLGFIQNDVINYTGDIIDALGEKDIVNNTLLIMPVLSIQLTEKWKTVIRPVIPINSFRTVDNVNLFTGGGGIGGVPQVTGVDLTRQTGLGDIVLWMALSKQYKPPDIFGFGITTMFDTASEDQLGTGKNSAGPMVLKFKITEKWIYGVVAQHWWSFSGQETFTVNTSAGPVQVDRADVSLTDIQPVLRYRVSAKTNIGFAPNWRYNWEAKQLDLPIGFGLDTLINVGPLPLKIGMEAYYFVESSSVFGPEWQFRLFFVPVFPAPKWAQKALF